MTSKRWWWLLVLLGVVVALIPQRGVNVHAQYVGPKDQLGYPLPPGVGLPLALSAGGTGTAFPLGVQAGQNMSFVGLFPNQIGSTVGVPSGFVNVKDAVFGAKGDCVQDDTNPIQSAITAAQPAAAHGAGVRVFLPATLNSCYRITQPLLIGKNAIEFSGASVRDTSAAIKADGFDGPALIVAPPQIVPYISNIAACQASHAYGAKKECKDSNGNIQFTVAGGTSGSSPPTWATVQGNSTTDGSVTWIASVIGTSLATGAGSTWSNVTTGSPPQWQLDLDFAHSMNQTPGLNGLAQFDIRFYLDVPNDFSGTEGEMVIVKSECAKPNRTCGGNQTGAFIIEINPSGTGICSGGHTCIEGQLRVGGVLKTVGSGTTSFTFGTTQEIELSYDGSNVRLFDNGTKLGSDVAATGTVTQGFYETNTFPADGQAYWPPFGAGGFNIFSVDGYIDSVQFSNVARHTANYTADTAKFSSDANTLLLMNFTAAPSPLASNVVPGTIGTGGSSTVYFPVDSNTQGSTPPAGTRVANLQLCPPFSSGEALFAVWAFGSQFDNLACTYGNYIPFDLDGDNFLVHMKDITTGQQGGSAYTNTGYFFGQQSNNNIYDHLEANGTLSGIVENGGSGTYLMPDYTGFGRAVYPFVFDQAQATLLSPTIDIEDLEPNFLADIYSTSAYAPIRLIGGQLVTPGSGSYLAIEGGAPINADDANFSGVVSQYVNVIANPTFPAALRNNNYVNVEPATNSGKSFWVQVQQAGQDQGMKFADLPATCTAGGWSGTSRFVTDADPAANPPVACTSAGAKTGSWADCVNNTWFCRN